MIHITARVDEMGPASLVTIHAGHGEPHPTPCGLLTMGPTEAEELVRRIEAGQIPHVDETLDPKTAAHVLWHYDAEGGMEPGDFTKPLISLIVAADRTNQLRLAAVYPEGRSPPPRRWPVTTPEQVTHPHADGATPACADHDSPEIFFRVSAETKAKAVCRACPLRSACLSYALANGVHGVWGGTTEEEREQQRLERGILARPVVTPHRVTPPAYTQRPAPPPPRREQAAPPEPRRAPAPVHVRYVEPTAHAPAKTRRAADWSYDPRTPHRNKLARLAEEGRR